MRTRTIAAGATAALAALAVGGAGCSSMPQFKLPAILRPDLSLPGVTVPFLNRYTYAASPNPLIVPATDFERVWVESVKILDEYFEIASEDRLSGVIQTHPRVGSTLLEPWAGDSVGFRERLESSLQTIRRHARVTIRPSPEGGLAVKVEVSKDLEDLVKPDRAVGGRAVFINTFPVNRTREVVGPVPIPIQWIPRGRDPKLEQVILARIREDLAL